MKRALALLLAAFGWVAGARTAEACAGCSNPNLPNVRSGNATLAPAEFSVALSLTGTTMNVVHEDRCPDIGPICLERDEPAQLHDQQFHSFELRPVVAVGITEVLGAELQLPIRMVNTSISFRRLDGTAFEPDYESIHHRDETLVGLADPWLLGRASARFDELTISTRAGIGLPVGDTVEDPFALGREGKSHQHIQFGTGTFFPVFAVDGSWDLSPLRLGGYGQAILYLYENGYGYHAGNRYAGGATGDVELFDDLRIGLGVDLLNEQPERWGGEIQQDGNVGRTDLLVGGMLSYQFGEVATQLSLRIPAWQHFIDPGGHHRDPGQLTYPGILSLSAQTSFNEP